MSKDPLEELFGPRDDDESGAASTFDDDVATKANDEVETRAETVPADAVTTAFESVPDATPDSADDASVGDPTFDWSEFEVSDTASIDPDAIDPVDPESSTSAAAAVPAAASAFAFQQRKMADDLATKPVPAAGKRSAKALPWIIVGVVALLLLVGALIFVNSIQAPEAAPEQTTEAPVTEDTPTEDTEETPTEAPEETPTEEPAEDQAPVVDPGATFPMEIAPLGISVDVSQQLTNVEWFSQVGPPERVLIQSGLMNSFPDSCAAMRSPEGMSPWGLVRGEGDTWTVVRPPGTCEAAPELYDQVWGLMQAMADSARPL
ncbi:MAG: hypothetical protein ACTIJ6_10170 [Leucobacter sp.]